MNLRPFGPEILRMSFCVFSCRQCYKKETLQNDIGRHGKTHSVADSLQQNADTDQRQCKTWDQSCMRNDHQKPLELRIIYHEMALNATGQMVTTILADWRFLIRTISRYRMIGSKITKCMI